MEKLHISIFVLALLILGCSQTAPASQQTAGNPPQQATAAPAPQGNEQQQSPEPQQTANPPLVDDTTAEAASSSKVKEFDMIARRFSFDPNVITVNKGDTVRLHITSADAAHGISLPEFDVNAYLAAGKTVDVEFVADQPGDFPFRCNVFCGDGHKSMTGMLVVN